MMLDTDVNMRDRKQMENPGDEYGNEKLPAGVGTGDGSAGRAAESQATGQNTESPAGRQTMENRSAEKNAENHVGGKNSESQDVVRAAGQTAEPPAAEPQTAGRAAGNQAVGQAAGNQAAGQTAMPQASEQIAGQTAESQPTDRNWEQESRDWEQQNQEQERRAAARKAEEQLLPVRQSFLFFAGLSLFFGLAYTFCLYKNPGGITYPLFVLAACACGVLACHRLHRPIKRGSRFLMAAAIVLGIGTCRTAEWFLIAVNGLALVLLGCVFGIHQFYEDGDWNLGKYFSSIILYLMHAAGQIPLPFRHLRSFFQQNGNGQVRRSAMVLKGLLLALPVLGVLIALLGAADVVFSDLIHEIVWTWFRPAAAFHLIFMIACGFFAMYGIICCCQMHLLKEDVPDRRKAEPLTALAFMGSIALVYAVFCAIQVFYLFLGKGSLPEGYTYSDYARQGFFELLFVAFINLIMVLCCLKYVRPSRILYLLLTLICGCTYVMLASAVYRMCLYVQVYHLTYLRLVTLWFLAMLAVLLAGVTRIIWKPDFHLFRFGLVIVTVFYTALVWARPGEILGWDYVNHMDQNQVMGSDIRYLVRGLSADAAPAIASLDLTADEVCDAGLWNGWEFEDEADIPNVWMRNYYELHAGKNYGHMGLRNYNFSLARVKSLIPDHAQTY